MPRRTFRPPAPKLGVIFFAEARLQLRFGSSRQVRHSRGTCRDVTGELWRPAQGQLEGVCDTPNSAGNQAHHLKLEQFAIMALVGYRWLGYHCSLPYSVYLHSS